MEKQEKPTCEAQGTRPDALTDGHSKTAKPMVAAKEVSDRDESPTKKRKTMKPTPMIVPFVERRWKTSPVEDAPSSLTMPSTAPFSFLHAPSPASLTKTKFGTKASAPRDSGAI
ncbi:hypothetical protein EDB19DRAFT_1914252 [Suillus lakei]|nr:hypothetical protein EDB19DRAFT_1914252 [Suillus lakei]